MLGVVRTNWIVQPVEASSTYNRYNKIYSEVSSLKQQTDSDTHPPNTAIGELLIF